MTLRDIYKQEGYLCTTINLTVGLYAFIEGLDKNGCSISKNDNFDDIHHFLIEVEVTGDTFNLPLDILDKDIEIVKTEIKKEIMREHTIKEGKHTSQKYICGG